MADPRRQRRFVQSVKVNPDGSIPSDTPVLDKVVDLIKGPAPEPVAAPAPQAPIDPTQVGSTWRRMGRDPNPVISTIGNAVNAVTSRGAQIQSNVMSGLIQTPTDVIAMGDMARVGLPALIQAIPDDTQQEDSYTDRLAAHFTNNMFGDKGMANMQDAFNKEALRIEAENPTLAPEQKKAMLDEWQKSDQFYEVMTNNMSPGLRLGAQANAFANNITGVNARPDQQTAWDDVFQAVGGAAIGVPVNVVEKLTARLTRVMGEKAARSVGMRIAGKAAELLTPGTFPFTPGNVAANAAVGAGMSEGIRALSHAPTVIGGQGDQSIDDPSDKPIADPRLEPQDGHGANLNAQIDNGVAATGATLAAFFSLPAFRKAIASGVKAGPSLAEQGNALKPILSPITGLADSQAPLTVGAKKMGATPEMVDSIDAQLGKASASNMHQEVSNVTNFGVLANHNDTIPIEHIKKAASQLNPDDYDVFQKYLYAKQRQQDSDIYEQTLTEQARRETLNLQAAQARGDNRAIGQAQTKLADLHVKRANLVNDTVDSRSSMIDWSEGDVQAYIHAGEQNPNVSGVVDLFRRSTNDMMSYTHNNGVIDSAEMARRLMNRNIYVPMREVSRADMVDQPLRRKGMLFLDRVFGNNSKTEYDFHSSDAARNVEGGDRPRVNIPKDPLVALTQAWDDAVRSVTANNARRAVVDTLRATPQANGTMYKQFEFDVGNGRKVSSMSPEQYQAIGRKQVEAYKRPLTRVIRNGKYEFYDFSDEGMTRAMEFAPMAHIPIWNQARKVWQTATTGAFAPWFAVKSVTWDPQVVKMTAPKGRSFGFIDTYARMLFNESSIVNHTLDHLPDPSAFLSVTTAMPYAVSMRAARALGHKIGDDLALNSGVFGNIAKLPGGRQVVDNAGTALVAMFDRSVFNVMSRNMSMSVGLLNDNTRIADDFNRQTGRINALGETAKNFWHGYKAMIESVQGGAKVAYFYENYARLHHKYQGNIPKDEIDSLVYDVRRSSGDMSKMSGNKAIQLTSSAFPYINPTIQGTRHILASAKDPQNASKFWAQFVGSAVLPAVGAYTVLSQWQGALEYWQNNTPEWRQMSGLPLPNPEAWYEYMSTGKWPAFSPDKLTILELAPEITMLLNPVLAGMRSVGLLQNDKHVPTGMLHDMGTIMDQVTGFATPPPLQAAFAASGQRLDVHGLMSGQIASPINDLTFGGANADQMTWNSRIPRQVYDVVGALAGSAGQVAMQTLNTADIAYRDGQSPGEILAKATDTFKSEAVQRVPDIPLIYQTPNKDYAFTPESEYVYDTERALEPLLGASRQQSVETDSKHVSDMLEQQGMTPPQKISDPLLKDLSTLVYATLRKKGDYKSAADDYTETRKLLNGLAASRARWPEDTYHAKYNEIVQQQQQLKATQARMLQDLEQSIRSDYGQLFEDSYQQPFTFGNLANAVRKNVSK